MVVQHAHAALMKTTPVRAPILRRYLEATFGGGPETAAAVEGATLDEYVTLRRIRFPGSTPQGAARAAPTRELRNAGATLDAAPPPTKPPLRRFTEVRGLQQVDLGSHAIPEDVQILSLKGIRAITGWTGLRRFAALEDLNVVACGGPQAKGAPSAQVRWQQRRPGGRVERGGEASEEADPVVVRSRLACGAGS